MKLTVLSENAVLYPGLEGEFGLSVYLEEGDTRLLFDAGERDACLRNAEKLGIDPAVMASPFITTIVDALSLLIYFFFATWILPL